MPDLKSPLEYDFRVAWERVNDGWAWVVEIRGLGISVHDRKSYSAAVRLAEIAVARVLWFSRFLSATAGIPC